MTKLNPLAENEPISQSGIGYGLTTLPAADLKLIHDPRPSGQSNLTDLELRDRDGAFYSDGYLTSNVIPSTLQQEQLIFEFIDSVMIKYNMSAWSIQFLKTHCHIQWYKDNIYGLFNGSPYPPKTRCAWVIGIDTARRAYSWTFR